MSDTLSTTCPHCGKSFEVSSEQLQSAGGRVRCGACLQVFNGIEGEIDFVPPVLPDGDPSHPLSGINVSPMSNADMPAVARRRPWVAIALLLTLLAGLAYQLYLPWAREQAERTPVELARIAVRAHPEIEGALRMDAILRNTSEVAEPYPLLVLGFTNRQGEPRARRTFLPAEYLHGSQGLKLPARSEMQISLSIADPGRDAVNYVARLESAVSLGN